MLFLGHSGHFYGVAMLELEHCKSIVVGLIACCYAVAKAFLVFLSVAMQLLDLSERFLKCCYAIARLLYCFTPKESSTSKFYISWFLDRC